jgi:hypothetical protein
MAIGECNRYPTALMVFLQGDGAVFDDIMGERSLVIVALLWDT